ncbi:hypothetical protein [Saccharopolyspora phatthalungensis]|uniref:Uncharacterized protein n=1 Tax=Saccharopolyspora phatthalungensis TaxID=664693 RepID=A0A840PR20_9PSEU|nr:hypothetical protein [Saccharopolyspora phatthalungensis]MBB5152752.1 hypothetical protein [Saccharopolyspora phatthalungensis]
MLSTKQFQKLLERDWLDEGDRVMALFGGEGERGYLGATIGGRHVVPHRPVMQTENLNVDFGALPLPAAVVRDGRFHGDEWVHDPAMRGWLYAATPQQLAVQCADRLAAAGPEGWFVSTPARLAVVVDASAAGEPDDVAQQKTVDEKGAEEAKGIGRWLGKARSAVSAVADLSDSLRPGSGPSLITLWECRRDQLTSGGFITKGRNAGGVRFARNEFVDGSVLELRMA